MSIQLHTKLYDANSDIGKIYFALRLLVSLHGVEKQSLLMETGIKSNNENY